MGCRFRGEVAGQGVGLFTVILNHPSGCFCRQMDGRINFQDAKSDGVC